MLANCTIVNENYNNIVDFKPGKSAKAAKLSTYKNFYPKTVEIMKKFQKKEEPVATPEVNTQNVVEPTVTSEPQVTNQVSQSVAETPVETNLESLPTAEFYQGKLDKLGVTCYNDVGVKGKIIPHAAKRLRTAKLVPDRVKDARIKVGVEKPILEEEKIEIKEDVKPTFDFGSLQNMSSTLNTPEVKETPEISKEVQSKPTLSVDDYFKKDTVVSSSQVENTSLELEEARKNYESVVESLETQHEIKAELEREFEELKKQRIIKIEKDKKETKELNQKTLDKTQELHDVLAAITQLKDAINGERQALGLNEENYKKIV